jgi:hypothetical protein
MTDTANAIIANNDRLFEAMVLLKYANLDWGDAPPDSCEPRFDAVSGSRSGPCAAR